MSTTQLSVLQGPGFHELVDAFKYAFAPLGKDFTVGFRLLDPQGALTGYAQPVFKTRIIGLKHKIGDRDTLLLTALLELDSVEGSPTWRIDDDEYRYSPARARSGHFNLRRIH